MDEGRMKTLFSNTPKRLIFIAFTILFLHGCSTLNRATIEAIQSADASEASGHGKGGMTKAYIKGFFRGLNNSPGTTSNRPRVALREGGTAKRVLTEECNLKRTMAGKIGLGKIHDKWRHIDCPFVE